jgi:hypothetical protein
VLLALGAYLVLRVIVDLLTPVAVTGQVGQVLWVHGHRPALDPAHPDRAAG